MSAVVARTNAAFAAARVYQRPLMRLLKDVEQWVDEIHFVLALLNSEPGTRERDARQVLEGYRQHCFNHAAIALIAQRDGFELSEGEPTAPGLRCVWRAHNALTQRLDDVGRTYLPIVRKILTPASPP